MSRFHPDELLICSTVSLATAAQSKESVEFSNISVPRPTEPMSLWDILVVQDFKKRQSHLCERCQHQSTKCNFCIILLA